MIKIMAVTVQKVLKGKTLGVKNNILIPIIGIGGGALGLWYLLDSGAFKKFYQIGAQKQAPITVAQRLIFNVYPPVVKPFRQIKVRGQFEDMAGNAAPVQTAYYAIFENVAAGPYVSEGRQMVSRGNIGNYVSVFDVNITTENFRPGPYTIYISNKPILSDPLKGKSAELQLVGERLINIA